MSRHSTQPATILSGLLEEVEHLKQFNPIDDLRLQRLRSGARQLMKADPAEGHIALGAVAALDWSVEAVHEHYQNALRMVDDGRVRAIYAASLKVAGQMLEALDQHLAACRLAPEDGCALRSAFSCAVATGSFSQAEVLLAQWGRSFPAQPIMESDSLESFQSVVEEVKRQQLDEDQIKQSFELAYTICQQRRVRPIRITMNRVRTGGRDRPWDLVSAIHVRALGEEAAEMSMELFDRVCDFPEMLQHSWKGFLVSFRGEEDDVILAR